MKMENEVPNGLPTLSRGPGKPGSGKVCAQQALEWLMHGRMDELGQLTDHPMGVNGVLVSASITVNDNLSDARRVQMWPLLLRMVDTQTSYDLQQQLVSLKLSELWSALQRSMFPAGWPVKFGEVTFTFEMSPDGYVAPTITWPQVTWQSMTFQSEGRNDDQFLLCLSELVDKYERLTSHTPVEVDPKRLVRLGELVGVSN
jgi:hypothetical protein